MARWGNKGAGCLFVAAATKRIGFSLRSAYVYEPHTYATFGGKIERGEEPLHAALREAEEETGQEIAPIAIFPLMVFREKGFRYYNFLVVVPEEFDLFLDPDDEEPETDDIVWVRFGAWPEPLHFGTRALLQDPASVTTIRAVL
jgi:8-oxo-dGTP pyrophosphatase MutT (NUDIX family)